MPRHDAERAVARVVQVGLGSIGRGIARRVLQQGRFDLAGAVDPAPALAGRDVGELVGAGAIGLRVGAHLGAVLEAAKPQLVLHSTASYLEEVAPQILAIVRRGISVVSTCEELAFPFVKHPARSLEIDAAARAGGAVVLGTGVNPGFVMDKLVVTLMSACASVREVRVSRVVDAARRREPFQRKIGAGLAPAEFEERARTGRLGHVGLAESAHLLAEAMGLGRQRQLDETLRPVVASERRITEHVTIAAGQVAGLRQSATLTAAGRRVHLELELVVGALRQRDAVTIEGSPPLEMEITSGVPGDEGTVSVVVHCAALVDGLQRGLRTMLEVPLRPAHPAAEDRG
jgi:4-hydroxy-tetrahydrodipicolinate reductase